MHSGGGLKEAPYQYIYIECGSEEEGKLIFYNRFGHAPERISCTCCGDDYSISFGELEELTAYDRKGGLRNWDRDDVPLQPLEDYFARPDVLAIPAREISDEERRGSLPRQGYVWVD
jgi:hypothetical protein